MKKESSTEKWHASMDSQEHRGTYQLFLKIVAYSTVISVAALAVLALTLL